MIQRLAVVLRARARSHVKAMRDEPGVHRRPGHAYDIAGVARALKPVRHYDVTFRLAVRMLRLDQHLRLGIGLNQPPLFGKCGLIVLARIEIRDDREDVRIAEKWLKRPHASEISLSQATSGASRYTISRSSRTTGRAAPSLRFRSSARITASARSRMERRSRRLSFRSRR